MIEAEGEPTSAKDWLLGHAGDIFGGIGAIVGFISGIKKAKATAEFREALLKSLQQIQSELHSIKADLDKILKELKKIEKSIEGLNLDPALTAIQAGGENMAALDPKDEKGRVNLANQIWSGSGSSPGLSQAMDTIHNAMIGQEVGGSNLIRVMDVQDILRMRARLFQGIHLLAFVCAFNDKFDLLFGVYLLQWSRKFRLQSELLMSLPEKYVQVPTQAWGGLPLQVSDSIALYQYVQPELGNIGLYIDIGGKPQLAHSGKMAIGPRGKDDYTPLQPVPGSLHAKFTDLKPYPIVPQGGQGSYLFINLKTGEHTLDPASALAQNCVPRPPFDDWLKVLLNLGPYGQHPNTLAARGTLMSAARGHPYQTFLGAARGHHASVADKKPYIGCLFDGASTAETIVILNDDKKTLKAAKPDDLPDNFDLENGLWKVTWAGKKDTVLIFPLAMADDKTPTYLKLSADGKWALSQDAKASEFKVTPDKPVREVMGDPLKMSQSAIGLANSGQTKKALFCNL